MGRILLLVVVVLSVVARASAQSPPSSPPSSSELRTLHQLLNERHLTALFVTDGQTAYRIDFNAEESTLWIRSRYVGSARGVARVASKEDPSLVAAFSHGLSDLSIVSRGDRFGDDDFDYYSAPHKNVEIGSGITPEHAAHLDTIVTTLVQALSRDLTVRP